MGLSEMATPSLEQSADPNVGACQFLGTAMGLQG